VERLVDRFFRDRALMEYPLHAHKHAYQTGRYVETAIHSLVYKTERALKDGLIALEAFLAIEDAFDNTTFESVCKTTEEQGVEQGVVRWNRAMLGSQEIVMAKWPMANCPNGL
jgi:hypothetical protein